MADLYTSNYLIGVIEGLPALGDPNTRLLERYFGRLIEEDSEEIHFDKSIRYRIMAPFVSPLVEGAILEERGLTTETFKPAYIKPKTPLDPTRAVKRTAGEQIGGSLSAGDRQRLRVSQTLEDHRAYIERRLEWMAAQVLLAGSVVISGDKYPAVTVDFGRAAGLTVTLAGGDLWSDETNADPLANLHDWNEAAMKSVAGAPIQDFIMDPDAFKNFRKHPKVTAKLDLRREVGAELRIQPLRSEGLRYMGSIDGFDIWVYQVWYEDTIGTLVPFFASGTVCGASAGIEGVQHFGAIYDEGAGYQAMRYYPKSWVEDDPSRRFVMTQSAPLVVPGRVNATFKASVL